MNKFDKFLAGVKKYWKLIVAGLVVIAGIVAALLFRQRGKALERAVLAKDIAETERAVAKLEGKREAVKARIDDVDKRTADIDSALEEDTKQINVRKKAVDKMTIEEKAKRFRDLGY